VTETPAQTAARLNLKCDVCGQPAIGVASSIMPISFAYCLTCLVQRAEPIFIFEYHYDDVSHDGANLAPWFTECVRSYMDGKYITWDEFVKWRHDNGRGKSEPCDYPEPLDKPVDFGGLNDFFGEVEPTDFVGDHNG
jgi:hypothetical protein